MLPSLWPASQLCLGVCGSGCGTPHGLGWDARGNTDLDFVPCPPLHSGPPAHRWEARPRERTWGSAFLLRTWLAPGVSPGVCHLEAPHLEHPARSTPPGAPCPDHPAWSTPSGAPHVEHPARSTPPGDTLALRRTGFWPLGALSLVEMGHHREPACPACPP